MNSFYKNLGLWVVIGVVMILLYYISQQGTQSAKEMVFSELLDRVERGEVTEVVIKGGDNLYAADVELIS